MHTSLNILGLVLLLTAIMFGGCRNSVFHKDGLKEAVTEPLVQNIDKQADKIVKRVDDLELKKLVESSEALIGQTEKSMEKLEALIGEIKNTSSASTELIKTANELLAETKQLIPELKQITKNTNEILPEVKSLISSLNITVQNLNSLVKETRTEIKDGTTDSLWLKILPAIAILLGVLIGVFLIIRAIKK